MEIKDLAGISQPLTKLIEVVAAGIGAVFLPVLTRKNADASAYKIKTIAKAIGDSRLLADNLKYDNGDVVIDSLDAQRSTGLLDVPIEQRICTRISYQDAKKQANTERIVQYAVDELAGETDVSSEEVNADWISRFFRMAEDITTEEMQMLWGKILAGEVKRPKSYSLRTLDLLKNLAREEAELFVKVGHWAITDRQKAWLYFKDDKELEEMTGITFLDRLMLSEIGLLASNPSQFIVKEAKESQLNSFTCGSTAILIYREKGTPEQRSPEILFSEAGRQLLNFVGKKPARIDYIRKFASYFRREGVSIKYAQVENWMPDGEFLCGFEQELFLDTP
jgi:hypothetical protein